MKRNTATTTTTTTLRVFFLMLNNNDKKGQINSLPDVLLSNFDKIIDGFTKLFIFEDVTLQSFKK